MKITKFTILIKDLFKYQGKKCWIILEKHPINCKCTYCKEYGTSIKTKLHYGLNIPFFKSGWWVIKFWPRFYLKLIKKINDDFF